MRTTQAHVRRLSVVAAAACSLVALSACSGGSSSDAGSSATTAASTTSSSSTSSSTSSSVSSSASSSASKASKSSSGKSSSGKSSAGKSSSATSSKSKAPKTDPVAACKTANSKSNAAISQWNTAVSADSKSKRDAAARNMRDTATSLRKLPKKAGQKSFTVRVNAVAKDLETMAANSAAGKTVDPKDYNTHSEELRSYCQKVLTSQ